MFTSSAEVFRTRQALGDLRSFAARAPEETRARLIAGFPPSAGDGTAFLRRLGADGGRFRHGSDGEVHASILLAAALPDDDFPVFIYATALVLCDVLQSDDAPDTLYWNWEAFHDQFAMADAPARAALMNGFRVAELAGRVDLDPALDPALCLRRGRDAVIAELDGSGERGLLAAMLSEAAPEVVGRMWGEAESVSAAALSAFRYFHERPAGLAPPAPEAAPLIPF